MALRAVLSATVEETAQLMMSMWATPSYLRILSPSAGDDAELCEEWARWQRSCLSPARAREVFKMVLSADVSDLPAHVECPALVIDTTIGTANVIEAQSVGLAEQIPCARLVKLGFGDHFPIRPADTRAVLADICEFLTGERPESPTRRALATICFTDIVGHVWRRRPRPGRSSFPPRSLR